MITLDWRCITTLGCINNMNMNNMYNIFDCSHSYLQCKTFHTLRFTRAGRMKTVGVRVHAKHMSRCAEHNWTRTESSLCSRSSHLDRAKAPKELPRDEHNKRASTWSRHTTSRHGVSPIVTSVSVSVRFSLLSAPRHATPTYGTHLNIFQCQE